MRPTTIGRALLLLLLTLTLGVTAVPHTAYAAPRPATPQRPPPPEGGPDPKLSCKHNQYVFADGNGTFVIRNNCRHGVVNWGYRISAPLCRIATGPVVEAGMDWWRNGTMQGRTSPHTEDCTYVFHGTLKPARNGDHISYQDDLNFPVEVAGNPGRAHLHIDGIFDLVP